MSKTEQDAGRPRPQLSMTRVSALAATVLAVAAYILVGVPAAQGVLLGAIAGILGLWMMASRLRSAATIPPEKLHLAMVLSTYIRLPVYGLFLYLGYRVDPVSLHGLFGALAGLMVVRYVPVYSAIVAARAERNRQPPDRSND